MRNITSTFGFRRTTNLRPMLTFRTRKRTRMRRFRRQRILSQIFQRTVRRLRGLLTTRNFIIRTTRRTRLQPLTFVTPQYNRSNFISRNTRRMAHNRRLTTLNTIIRHTRFGRFRHQDRSLIRHMRIFTNITILRTRRFQRRVKHNNRRQVRTSIRHFNQTRTHNMGRTFFRLLRAQ